MIARWRRSRRADFPHGPCAIMTRTLPRATAALALAAIIAGAAGCASQNDAAAQQALAQAAQAQAAAAHARAEAAKANQEALDAEARSEKADADFKQATAEFNDVANKLQKYQDQQNQSGASQ